MTVLGDRDRVDLEAAGYNGEPVPMRTLFYDATDDREVHVTVDVDGMRAYVKVIPGASFSGLTRGSVAALLANAGVGFGIVEPGIQLFVNTQNSPAPFSGFWQVARGVPMRKGEDGSIEFHVQPTSLNPRYDENAAGGIDYKQLNLIENCFAGQRVASILPPGPGRPGRDVFGAEIAAVPGEAVAVQAGPGVVMSSNGRDFSSEIEGRLVFEDNTLSVSPLLEISHDIDYGVGNIDFVGKVTVNGSLLDGFSIRGKRGVELNGDMGAGHISSDGDVKITGGIKGKSAAIISCRSLSAHYIDDAMVEASGSVTATREIMNSSVKALGRIIVSNGAIIGGEVCAFQGVEADTLGSDMGVNTWVMAGLNWTEENRKDEIRSQMAEYMDRIQSAKVMLDLLFAEKEVTARLGSEQKSMLSEIITELRYLREIVVELLDERARIEGRDQVGLVDRINVRKMLCQGVSIRFSSMDALVNDGVKGPISVTPDDRHNSLAFGSMAKMPSVIDQESISRMVAEAARTAEAALGENGTAGEGEGAPRPADAGELPPDDAGDGNADPPAPGAVEGAEKAPEQ